MLQVDLRANICHLQFVDTGWCACVVWMFAFVQSLMCPFQAPEGMRWIIRICALFYALMYLVGFVLMLRHYRLPFNRAFDRCVSGL